jgi:phage tail-like protein
MSAQIPPYPEFPYCVELTPSSGAKALGWFSQVDGLPQPFGGNPETHPNTDVGLRRYGEITLKRGFVQNSQLWNGYTSVRTGGSTVERSPVLITLRDETGQPVARWQIREATPKRWIGPTQLDKGDSDVAIEELVLFAEDIELVPLNK